MASATNYTSTLEAFFLEKFGDGDPNSQHDAVLKFEPCGVAITAADFPPLSGDANDAATMLHNMSTYFSDVPDADCNRYTPTIMPALDAYHFILLAATPNDVQDSLFASVKSDSLNLLSATRKAFETEGIYQPVTASPADWCDPAATCWTSYSQKPEAGDATVPTGASVDLPDNLLHFRLLADAHPLMLKQVALPIQTAERPVSFPLALAHNGTPLMSGKPMTLNHSLTVGMARMQTGNFARINALRSNMLVAKQVPATTTGITISFDYCMARLNRPWLNPSFFGLQHWYMKDYKAGGIRADGCGRIDLRLLPVAIIAIKNLSIEAQWSAADKEMMTSSVSLGAFGFSKDMIDTNTSNIRNPGIQVIGYVCRQLPLLAPCDDPALLPSF